MKPYDWCNESCPNPCTCQETVEAHARADAAAIEKLRWTAAIYGIDPEKLIEQAQAIARTHPLTLEQASQRIADETAQAKRALAHAARMLADPTHGEGID